MASENGWEPSHAPADLLEWVVVPGTNPPVHLQFLKGWPSAIMRAYAADYNAFVEKLRDADSASFTPTNSVATSNHLNGTAMDLNWDSHEFRVADAGYSPQMIATMREILDFYEDTMFWANDWDNPKDAMHHQMGYDTWNKPWVREFIARKIRADGFSTFRRGGGDPLPPPPPEAWNAADVLVRATGVTPAKAVEILVGVVNGLRDSQCNNVNRIAMWLAQIGHESAGFNATEEYQSGDETQDRWKYKGRTWIQITWASNYAGLSKWAFDKGIVPTPTFFVDQPKLLAEIQYAGLGPAWYWTVARPQINSLCDQRNLVAVTQAINGGQNGAADRKRRYDMALALGDQLLALTTSAPPPTSGDDMAQVPQDQWDRVYREITQRLPSRSPLRHLGEGPIDTLAGFVLNVDGSQHVEIVKLLASLGHPPTVALLQEVAGADPQTYPDRQDDAKMAQAILADINKAPAPVPLAVTSAAPSAPEVVYLPAPAQPVPLVASTSTSTGQIIGAAFDALEALKNAQVALGPEAQASVDSLIRVLQPQVQG